MKNEQTAMRRVLNEMESRSRQQEIALNEAELRSRQQDAVMREHVQNESDLRAELERIEAQRQATEEECNALKGTISWRITEPLRTIRKVLRRTDRRKKELR